MAGIAAIGEPARVRGFLLAGVDVYAVDNPTAVLRAWQDLPRAVGVVILTQSAAEVLGAEAAEREPPLLVVMPP